MTRFFMRLFGVLRKETLQILRDPSSIILALIMLFIPGTPMDNDYGPQPDNSIKRQIKDGSLAKLYNKWFMQPTPPNNVVVGLPLTEKTKEAWTNPNNKPAEDYKL